MLTAIVGINWGDDGNGRMVDLLSSDYDIVARYQGGNNAGHTVINHLGKFVLNLLPSGILRENVVNVMGCGMVIDIEHLCGEIARLREKGVKISPENLKISDRAVICMPYHVMQDCLEEDRLGDAKYGSTRRGIGPVYGDKYLKKAIRMGDLLYPESTKKRLKGIVEWKNLTIKGAYGAEEIKLADMLLWLEKFGGELKDYICATGVFLENALKNGKKVMFEAQLGALRDIDYGIYPYTSSSSVIAAYAPIGAGIAGRKIDETIGIMKAYSTCVGEGPFVTELFGDEAEELRRAGGEYGAATGRPRRVGPFDAVASRYGVRVQGADSIALTKLDILSGINPIKVCTGYKIGDTVTENFPFGDIINEAEPIYEELPGWQGDISACRSLDELPKEAVDYIKYIEKAVDCKISYVSVGPDREQYIKL